MRKRRHGPPRKPRFNLPDDVLRDHVSKFGLYNDFDCFNFTVSIALERNVYNLGAHSLALYKVRMRSQRDGPALPLANICRSINSRLRTAPLAFRLEDESTPNADQNNDFRDCTWTQRGINIDVEFTRQDIVNRIKEAVESYDSNSRNVVELVGEGPGRRYRRSSMSSRVMVRQRDYTLRYKVCKPVPYAEAVLKL